MSDERAVTDREERNRNLNGEKYRKSSSFERGRSKSKQGSVRQSCQNSNQKESNFQRCKKLGLLKRNLAQNRLKKINSDVEVKKQICDKIEALRGSEPIERRRISDVLSKHFLSDETCLKYKGRSYSADTRLKRIKLACMKKLDSENIRSSVNPFNDGLSPALVEASFSQNCNQNSNEYFRDSSPIINVTRKKLPLFDKSKKLSGDQLLTNAVKESVDGNSVSMDVDIDFVEYDKLNKSETLNCSNNNSNYGSRVTDSNSTFVNNAISKLRKESSYLARYDDLSNDEIMNLAVPVGDLFVVVDTNIFLSHLNFIRHLLKYGIAPYRSPVIIVPWMVIQEIDYLMKKNDPELSKRARLANTFIYNCLNEKHPHFYGQSLKDFRENFENAVSIDDFILKYCLKFISMDNNVVLLTDDLNLCNKSMVNQLKVYTKAEFEKSFSTSSTSLI